MQLTKTIRRLRLPLVCLLITALLSIGCTFDDHGYGKEKVYLGPPKQALIAPDDAMVQGKESLVQPTLYFTPSSATYQSDKDRRRENTARIVSAPRRFVGSILLAPFVLVYLSLYWASE